MKKATKVAVIAFALLIIAAVPVYFYVRQNAGTEGSIQIKGAVSSPETSRTAKSKRFRPLTCRSR